MDITEIQYRKNRILERIDELKYTDSKRPDVIKELVTYWEHKYFELSQLKDLKRSETN